MIKYPKAWKATGTVFDHGYKDTRCALCSRNSRYVFEIVSQSGNRALVGPECLKKVKVPMASQHDLDDDIDEWLSKNKSSLMSNARARRLKKVLVYLKRAEAEANFSQLFDAVDSGKPLSPAQASWLASLCARHDLDVGDDLIRIDLRTKLAKSQLENMENWKKEQLKLVVQEKRRALIDSPAADGD